MPAERPDTEEVVLAHEKGQTAEALLWQALRELGGSPSPGLVDLFVQAGTLLVQRGDSSRELTTTLFPFAAVDLGPSRYPGVEGAFLTLFRNEFLKSSAYPRLRSSYLRNQALAKSSTTLASGLSNNVKLVLQRSARAGDGTVGLHLFLLTLLRTTEATLSRRLRENSLDGIALAATIKSQLANTASPMPSEDKGNSSIPVPPHQFNFVSPFGNDDPRSAVDLIDIRKEVQAFAELAASKKVPPPLSIGVFGNWGSGKSFFMEQMYKAIEDIIHSPPSDLEKSASFHRKIVQIRFNAWHYIETNLWASLVEYIFNELDAWLRKDNVERDKIDALFDQLETSRQLKLDSYRDLITAKRELKKAGQDLVDAQDEHRTAVDAAAAARTASQWSVIARTYWDQIRSNPELQKAANDLGLAEFTKSQKDFMVLVDSTRAEATRGKVIANSLLARLGSRQSALAAAGAVVGLPLLIAIVIGILRVELPSWQWAKELHQGLIAAFSAVGGLILVGGKWLGHARTALDKLDQYRTKLDENISDAVKVESANLKQAEISADKAREKIADAEKRTVEARERALAAKRDYDSESASGQLNRFIRGKVADATYAKHLGIIASIRKDFGQLAELMQASAEDSALATEVKSAEEQFLKKAQALIETSDGVLDTAERDDLLRNEPREQLPTFERIVLYIDDLDRCPPQNVVEVLQAIHMLLCFPLFVVVVAVDARWVSRALHARFPEMIADSRMIIRKSGKPAKVDPDTQPADAQDYLEKIFQIPYRVRRMDNEAASSFTKKLAGAFHENRLAEVPLDDPESVDDGSMVGDPASIPEPDIRPASMTKAPDIRPMSLNPVEAQLLADFAPCVGDSPRRAKRYVNLYLLLKTTLNQTPYWTAGESEIPIAALLAIVTGMTGAQEFFAVLDQLESTDLEALAKKLAELPVRPNVPEQAIRTVLRITSMEPQHHDEIFLGIRRLAPTVRRYSF